MAFSVDARVRVTAQNSQWRGKLGTVISVASDDHQVRLDGYPEEGKTVLLKTAELQISNFESPVTY